MSRLFDVIGVETSPAVADRTLPLDEFIRLVQSQYPEGDPMREVARAHLLAWAKDRLTGGSGPAHSLAS